MSNDILGAGPKLRPKVEGKLIPIKNHVIVEEMNFGERTTRAGIILLDDDGKDHGIRPRWAKVYSVGKTQKDIQVGQWILVDHGRWTRAIEVKDPDSGAVQILRRVDPNDILLTADEPPVDETVRDL